VRVVAIGNPEKIQQGKLKKLDANVLRVAVSRSIASVFRRAGSVISFATAVTAAIATSIRRELQNDCARFLIMSAKAGVALLVNQFALILSLWVFNAGNMGWLIDYEYNL
jgi:hypothetical protein